MLVDFYKAALIKAEAYLLNKGYVLRICNKDDPDYPLKDVKEWGVVWIVERVLGTLDAQILVALPLTFPDEFPQIFLSQKSFKIFPIPHLDGRRFLCTFDSADSAPNPDKPGEIVESFIEKGFTIIDDGIAKRNLSDYREEFLAYWDLESNGKLSILFSPKNERDEFVFLPFTSIKNGYWGVIAEQIEDIRNWCDALKISIDGLNVANILFLPLDSFGIPPYPATNAELHKRLKEYSPHSLKELIKYFKGRTDPYYVLFSVPTPAGHVLGFWHHYGLSKKDIVDGFPRGNVPAEYLLSKHPDKRLMKRVVDRVDRQRLFARGGCGLPLSENAIASVIGCGSIGSTLAYSLVRSGLKAIDLIDPEELTSENVARHFCGFSDIAKNKSQVLRERLRLSYPYLHCKAYGKDILLMLSEDASILNKYTLNIVAIGRLAVEKRLNLLAQDKAITSPFLFVWVEPFLVAGHALFVNPSKPGCFECILDAVYKVKYSVVEEASKFAKREAGCQTTYIPYPSLEIDRFVNSITRFVMPILNGDLTDSTLFTWLGDIDSFRKKGEVISAYWASDSSYTEHVMNLSSKQLCERCSSKVST